MRCIVVGVTEKREFNKSQTKGDLKMATIYDLIPTNGRKSFYGKAKVQIENGVETLLSYNTPIIKKSADGTLTRLYQDEPSMTTLTHIKSFCGLDKKKFMALA